MQFLVDQNYLAIGVQSIHQIEPITLETSERLALIFPKRSVLTFFFLRLISQESPNKTHWEERFECPFCLSQSENLTDTCCIFRLWPSHRPWDSLQQGSPNPPAQSMMLYILFTLFIGPDRAGIPTRLNCLPRRAGLGARRWWLRVVASTLLRASPRKVGWLWLDDMALDSGSAWPCVLCLWT